MEQYYHQYGYQYGGGGYRTRKDGYYSAPPPGLETGDGSPAPPYLASNLYGQTNMEYYPYYAGANHTNMYLHQPAGVASHAVASHGVAGDAAETAGAAVDYERAMAQIAGEFPQMMNLDHAEPEAVQTTTEENKKSKKPRTNSTQKKDNWKKDPNQEHYASDKWTEEQWNAQSSEFFGKIPASAEVEIGGLEAEGVIEATYGIEQGGHEGGSAYAAKDAKEGGAPGLTKDSLKEPKERTWANVVKSESKERTCATTSKDNTIISGEAYEKTASYERTAAVVYEKTASHEKTPAHAETTTKPAASKKKKKKEHQSTESTPINEKASVTTLKLENSRTGVATETVHEEDKKDKKEHSASSGGAQQVASHSEAPTTNSSNKKSKNQTPKDGDKIIREEVIGRREEQLKEQYSEDNAYRQKLSEQKEREKALRQKQREAAERFIKEAAEKRKLDDEKRAEVRKRKNEELEKLKTARETNVPTDINPEIHNLGNQADRKTKFQGPGGYQGPGGKGNSRAAPGFESPKNQQWWSQGGGPSNYYRAAPGNPAYNNYYNQYQQQRYNAEDVIFVDGGNGVKTVNEDATSKGTNGSGGTTVVENGEVIDVTILGEGEERGTDEDAVEELITKEIPLEILWKGGDFTLEDEFIAPMLFKIPPFTKPGTRLVNRHISLIVCLEEQYKKKTDGGTTNNISGSTSGGASEGKYVLDGADLTIKTTVDFYRSLIGGTYTIDLFGEELVLEMTKIVRTGDILVYPNLGWKKEGRLIVEFTVEEVKQLSTELKEFIAKEQGMLIQAEKAGTFPEK